jgi:hypothetical protein
MTASRVTANEKLLRRIGMFREDNDFNRRADKYARGANEIVKTRRYKEVQKKRHQLNEERLRP